MSLVLLASLGLAPLSFAVAGALVDIHATLMFGVAGAIVIVAVVAELLSGVPSRMRDEVGQH